MRAAVNALCALSVLKRTRKNCVSIKIYLFYLAGKYNIIIDIYII